MTMDYHHPYNVYPEYYCPAYQGSSGYPQYPYNQQPQHYQNPRQNPATSMPRHDTSNSMPRQSTGNSMSGPVRNFNNNLIAHPPYSSCHQPQQQQQQQLQHLPPNPNHPSYYAMCQQPTNQSRSHSSYASQQQQQPYVPNFLVSSGTGLTPTLTPTTLATIEQSFLELHNAQQNGSRDPVTQSGFVPPVVDPGHSAEQSQDSQDYSSSESDWEPRAKRGRMVEHDVKDVNLIVTAHGTINATPQRKYTRRNKDEKLPPEEERRRQMRRERNKLAAAKCRQRRVDHTNELVEETEKLEAEQSKLESEIQSLQQEREQLEFILQAHQPMCKVEHRHMNKVKMDAPLPSASSHIHHQAPSDPMPENLSMQATMNNVPQSSAQRPNKLAVTTSLPASTGSGISPTSSMANARPNSLPLIKRDRARMLSMTNATGVTINTPTSGAAITPSSLIGPGLDSIVDGSTGLTPLTGMSCSSQVQRNTSESNSEAVGSPTLISL